MMSANNGAKRLVQSFNSWAKEGCDMMGGANSGAIEEMLRLAYLDDDPGETQPSSKSTAHYEYSLVCLYIIIISEEDFQGASTTATR